MKAYSICLLISAILCVTDAMANYYDPTEGIDQFNERLARIAPNMIYLGNYANKGWYAFNDLVTQPTARQNCINFGMKLGIIDSQGEVEFIANGVTEPLYYTDGNYFSKPLCFRWSSGLRELNPDLQIVLIQNGLGLEKSYKGLLGLGSPANVLPYLCFTSLVSWEAKTFRDTAVLGSGTAIKFNGFSELANNDVPSNQTVLGLTYVGKYGYKSFYYDDALVLWATAKENCEKMGMSFVRFDSQDELEWILSVLPTNQSNRIWTDGETKEGSQYWYWTYNGNNLNNGIIVSNLGWGLVLARSQRSLSAYSKLSTAHTYPYICFIVTLDG